MWCCQKDEVSSRGVHMFSFSEAAFCWKSLMCASKTPSLVQAYFDEYSHCKTRSVCLCHWDFSPCVAEIDVEHVSGKAFPAERSIK